MLRATIGEALPLQIQVGDGRADLYPQVSVHDYTGAIVVGPLDLPHFAGGLYGSIHTFNSEGNFTAIYRIYTDVGHTTAADYDVEAESIEATYDKTNILKMLGIVHHNTVEDMFTYDGAGNLTSVRVRAYDSDTNALAAKATSPANGTVGLLFLWNITALYSSGRLSLYAEVEE